MPGGFKQMLWCLPSNRYTYICIICIITCFFGNWQGSNHLLYLAQWSTFMKSFYIQRALWQLQLNNKSPSRKAKFGHNRLVTGEHYSMALAAMFVLVWSFMIPVGSYRAVIIFKWVITWKEARMYFAFSVVRCQFCIKSYKCVWMSKHAHNVETQAPCLQKVLSSIKQIKQFS